jgi:TRAP-type C4-dicarboxylate transport system substrate-binding protein
MRHLGSMKPRPAHIGLGRPTLALTAALLGAASLAACSSSGSGSSASTTSGKTITGNISVSQPTGTPIAEVAQDFATAVDKATHGQVVLKVYPHDELGSGTSIVQGCEEGTIAFCQEQTLSAVVPSIQAPQAPYLFTSIDNASQVLNNSSLTAVWQPEFQAKGLDYLGQWALPPSSIGTTSTAVETPANLKGLRLRVPNADIGALMFKPVGADPVQIDSTQVTTSLSTNVIDGIDDPLPTLITEGWIDELHYLTISNDWYGADALVASSKFMKELSPANQAAVQQAFTASLAQNNQLENAQEQQALTKLKGMNVKVIQPASLASFKAAFSSVNPALVKEYPSVMNIVLKLISS